MNTKSKMLGVAMLMTTLSGCVSTIGQEDFTCNSLEKKNGVCAGPRDIYELTNNRDSLENLTVEELHNQVHKASHGVPSNLHANNHSATDDNYVYEPRSNEQHTAMDYQHAEVIAKSPSTPNGITEFSRWPSNGEPLAPEALAVMQEPKPMRILVSSYTDANGVFHVPGYAFVNTQSATWIKGRAADLRPTRVVPLEMSLGSDRQMERIEQQRRGVSGLGVTRKPMTQEGY
jgi:hypothetical protein